MIDPKGFHCHVYSGFVPPEFLERSFDPRFMNLLEWEYDSYENQAYLHEQIFAERYHLMFSFRQVPYTVTADSLFLGKTVKLKLKRK